MSLIYLPFLHRFTFSGAVAVVTLKINAPSGMAASQRYRGLYSVRSSDSQILCASLLIAH